MDNKHHQVTKLFIAVVIVFSLLCPSILESPVEGVKTASANFEGDIWQEYLVPIDDLLQGQMEGLDITTNNTISLNPDSLSGRYTSPILRMPQSFSDFASKWMSGSGEDVKMGYEIRTSADGDTWSEWIDVMAIEEDIIFANGYFNGPLIFIPQIEGPHTFIQFSITLDRPALEAKAEISNTSFFLIDTSNGPSMEDVLKQQQEIDKDSNGENNSTNTVPKPPVISRTAWGCPEGQGSPRYPPQYATVHHIIIHHTATPNYDTNWASRVRAIWEYHANFYGWGDIGYNFLVDPNGNIYEGRAGGDDAIGIHAGKYNAGTMGVSLLGCFDSSCDTSWGDTNPKQAAINAVTSLTAWKVDQRGLDPNAQVEHNGLVYPVIAGHHDVDNPNICPGENLYNKLGLIRENVDRSLSPTLQILVQSPTLTPSDNGNVCSTGWYGYQNDIGYNSYLTISTNDPGASTNSGEWRPALPISGQWKVEAFIPNHPFGMWPCGVNPGADTASAEYQIFHNGTTSEVIIDQEPIYSSWVDLGTYYFAAGQNGYVWLSDLTNDANFSRYVSFAAMRFTYQPQDEIIVSEPNLTPPYSDDTCVSGWYRYVNNLDQYGYLTIGTNNPSSSTNSGRWTPNLPQSGLYVVEVYVPDHPFGMWPCGVNPSIDTASASYKIHTPNGDSYVAVDQGPLTNAWANLGTYYFTSGQSGYVELTDLTNDENFTRYVSFSSVRFTPTNSADVTMPTGAITYPANNSTIGAMSMQISADAFDNPGGSGVKEVVFWVSYSNGPGEVAEWHEIGRSSSSPYRAYWTVPFNLRSQILEFGIHVEDQAGNYCIDPGPNYSCNYIQSIHQVIYRESIVNPAINENWLPTTHRSYLNQLALGDDLEQNRTKCSGASAAMMLASMQYIDSDFNSLKSKANEIWQNLIDDARGTLLAEQINANGLEVQSREYTPDPGWDKITEEIDQGHPVILLSSKMSTAGHYIVIIGYREEGLQREVIAYDPYGLWYGVVGEFNANTFSQNSYKGRWVYYNLDVIWGRNAGWFWNRNKTTLITITEGENPASFTSDMTNPDKVSNEPDLFVHYEGIPIQPPTTIFLPVILR
ncbi:MAG TPA: N-acetylmuramoyl-L-alanine amidase [Anaerolineaceae bacterium]|nr:N-acetylmuramoyl-L-alanine amidase [Anaerolineaceae bacterium]